MSDTLAAKKAPIYEAFKVHGEGKTARWTKVGAVWENAKGLTLDIPEGIAVSGRIICLKPRDAASAESNVPEPEAPSV